MEDIELNNYDFVIPIFKYSGYFRATLEAIKSHYNPRRVLLISSKKTLDEIKHHIIKYKWDAPKIKYIDEDHIIGNCTYEKVKQKWTGTNRTPGWYFQQYLKYAPAFLEDVSEWYVAWDSDLVPLEPWPLNVNGVHYFAMLEKQYKHIDERTFDSGIKLFLGLDPVDPLKPKTMLSHYVSHHMPFNKTYVRQICKEIEIKFPNANWWETLTELSIFSKECYTCPYNEKKPRWSEYLGYFTWMNYFHPKELKFYNPELYGGTDPERIRMADPGKYKSTIYYSRPSIEEFLSDFGEYNLDEGIEYKKLLKYALEHKFVKETRSKIIIFEQ